MLLLLSWLLFFLSLPFLCYCSKFLFIIITIIITIIIISLIIIIMHYALDIFFSHLRWVSSVLHHVMWICRLCPTLAGSCRPYLGAIELLWIGVGIATLKFSFNICDKNLCLRGFHWKGEKIAFCAGTFHLQKGRQKHPLLVEKQFNSALKPMNKSCLTSKEEDENHTCHTYQI